MLFIDTGSIYASVKSSFEGDNARVNYRAYESVVASVFGEQARKYAYVNVKDSRAHKFVQMFKRMNYTTRYRNIEECEDPRIWNFNVDLTMDVMAQRDRNRPIIIGSSNGELLPLLKRLKKDNYIVMVYACGIPSAWKEYATVREITHKELIKAPTYGNATST